MAKGGRKHPQKNNGANLGFEEKPWQAADKMRGHMDPGEYKHVALGLSFLKYISDAFAEHRRRLAATLRQQQAEAAKLDAAIEANLKGLGYGG